MRTAALLGRQRRKRNYILNTKYYYILPGTYYIVSLQRCPSCLLCFWPIIVLPRNTRALHYCHHRAHVLPVPNPLLVILMMRSPAAARGPSADEEVLLNIFFLIFYHLLLLFRVF